MRNKKAPTTLEVGDSATDPSVIGYPLPWGNLPTNRSTGAIGGCVSMKAHLTKSVLYAHTFGTGLGLVGSNRYEATNV